MQATEFSSLYAASINSSEYDERTSNSKKTSTSTCSSNALEKGNLAFVAEPKLVVEGTHTYCTENTVRGTVRETKPIDKA